MASLVYGIKENVIQLGLNIIEETKKAKLVHCKEG